MLNGTLSLCYNGDAALALLLRAQAIEELSENQWLSVREYCISNASTDLTTITEATCTETTCAEIFDQEQQNKCTHMPS